jgi:hypothetical protein
MNYSKGKKARLCQAANACSTHLIVTATRIIIIPTDNMAMMTPHIMNQTLLFGSSAINKSEIKINVKDGDFILSARLAEPAFSVLKS